MRKSVKDINIYLFIIKIFFMKLALKLLAYLSFVIISFRLSAQTNQIGPTGKVGIGTDNPSDLLHVKFDPAALGFSQGIRIQTNYANFSTGRGGGIVMQNADVNTAAIFGIREENNWKGALTFYTHTSGSGNSFGTTFTEKMRLTNVGNLGIGITNPSSKLYVNDNTGGAFGTVIKNSNNSGHGLLVQAGGTSGTRYIMQLKDAAGNNRFTVHDEGYVSIGDINPEAMLHLKPISNNWTSSGWGKAIQLEGHAAIAFETPETNFFTLGAKANNRLFLGKTNSTGGSLEYLMTFEHDGNIGIGTTSPDHLLSLQDGSLELFGSEENSGTYSTGHHGAIQIYAKGNGSKFEGARIEGLRRGSATDQSMSLSFFVNTGSNLLESMRLNNDGNVGIGTPIPDAKLTVKGNIHTNEVKVDLLGAVAPDYVFADDYHLRSLEEVENYTNTNSHLPEIPSAAEMAKNGVYLKEMNMKLLQKVEELTLYLIEEHKQNKDQQKRIEEMEKEIELLKSR